MAGTIIADDIQHSTAGSVGTEYVVNGSKMWSASNGDTTIHDSFNLSSITDNGNGDNTYTVSSAFSNAYYSISAIGRSDDNANARMAANCLTSHRAIPTSSVFNLSFHYDNASRRECDYETTSAVGELA